MVTKQFIGDLFGDDINIHKEVMFDRLNGPNLRWILDQRALKEKIYTFEKDGVKTQLVQESNVYNQIECEEFKMLVTTYCDPDKLFEAVRE